MKELVKRMNAELILVGDGNYVPYLTSLINRLNLGDRVIITGWLPFREAMKYVTTADLCLVPGIRTPETEFSFPNKIQQYMYFSKPILTADLKFLRRIVIECRCGILYDPEDPKSFVNAVIKSMRELKELGRNGRDYLENRMNWGLEEKKLLGLYGSILRRIPGQDSLLRR